MKALYDKDIDYLEVMDSGGRKSVGMHVSDELTVFYTEKDRKIVGFALDDASHNVQQLEHMPQTMLLAAIVRLARGILGDTIAQFADRLSINEKTIRRLEAGDANSTLKTLNRLNDVTPNDIDVLKLLSQKHAQEHRAR